MDKHYPDDLLYTKEHEWCRVKGDTAIIGITWHAQDALGDVVFCELPAVNETISVGQPFGVVESVKAVSDLYAPVSGTVLERNDDLVEAPEGLNEDCYDEGWMLKVKLTDPSEVAQLLKQADYVAFLESQAE